GYGLPIGDLIQEGNVGLMKAVKRFDPALNVRLESFAVHWIRAEIHEYVNVERGVETHSTCPSCPSRCTGFAPRFTSTCCATGGWSRSPPPRRSASSSSTCAA